MNSNWDLANQTAKSLRSLADLVEQIGEPIRTTYAATFAELRSADKKSLRAKLRSALGRKSNAIYAIRLAASDGCDLVWEALDSARKQKLEARAYARVHPFQASEYIYVGSSADVAKRLIEHFGFGAKSTYSLHLTAWAGMLSGGVEVDLMMFDGIDQNVLQALEDQCARELRPMFGRRGSV